MANLQSFTEPPSDAERIAALQARNAELELELQQIKQRHQQAEATSQEALSLVGTLLEATADGILVINAQGFISYFNHKFVELWQVPESMIALQEDWQLLPFMQEQLNDSEVFLNRVRAEHSQVDLESHSFLEFKDGKIVERYSKPQVLGEHIIGRVISYRNTTACKQVETELRESQQLLQAVLDAAPMRIYLKDLQGRYVMYNRHWQSVMRLGWEQVIGKTDRELFDPEIANYFQATDRAALEAGKAITIERNLQEVDGIHTYITTKFPVFDADGNPYGVCGISTDISDRKRMEEALCQSEERFSKAFRANPAATTITTLAEGRYIDVNDSFLRLLGFNREEVIGKTSVELGLWVADRSQVMSRLIEQLQEQPIYNLEIKFRTKFGEIRDGISSAVLIDLSGELCMLAQLYDVTDRKRAETALKYRVDFEALLTSISTHFINLKAAEVDRGINQALQQIGEFAQVDRACIFLIFNERFFNTHQWFADGIPPLVYPEQGLALETISETMEQLRQFKIIHTPNVEDLSEPRKSISQSFGVKSYIAVPITYEGCLIGSLAFNSIRTTKTWSAEDAALLGALANIFASALMRKRSEEALRESEERFRQLAENVNAVFWMSSIDGQQTLYTSPAYEKIWGRSVQSLYEGDVHDWLNSIHPDDRALVIAARERQNRGEVIEKIFRIIKPDGSLRWIRDRAFPVRDPQGRLYRIAGISDDITDRKLAEDALRESQAKLHAILGSAIASIARFRVFANREWDYEYFSPGSEVLYGYTPEELTTDKTLWGSRILPEDLENTILSRYEDIFAERTIQLEYRFQCKNGIWRWQSMTLFSQRDETANCWVVTSVSTDISDRKQAEEQLEASLQEKEALLKEVHHRVKNNLQVISSLLDLQSMHIQEPQILEMFQESQNRVRSMALIHEKLYQSDSLSRVNLADYVQSLAMSLIETYAVNPDSITLQLHLEPVALSLDTAIPCGLILNELVSNALKHAFPNNKGGTIWIGLYCLPPEQPSEERDVFELVVGNDGVKFSKLPDFSRAKSLGFQLVNILTQQLNGQIAVTQNQGTEIKLRFSDL